MNKIIYSILLLGCFTAQAQVKFGSNPANINASAALEVESTTKGMLPPRMTNAQAYAIATPATGLMVYNTTLKCLSYFDGNSWNCTFVTPQPAPSTAPLGSTYTSHFNGVVSGPYTGTATTVTHTTGETFNALAGCATKMISAGNTSCPASVTGVSGTVYPIVLINGQCWMSTNLKEVPTNFSGNTATSWLATSPGDLGYSGYFNTADVTGASGWGITEPAANEGLLYQWSAAMNNSMTERTKGNCPAGYHVPSDCEWSFLEHGLGMSLSQNAISGAWRDNTAGGGNVGSKLRSQGTGNNNASGFAALLYGTRNTDGTFTSRPDYGRWWTSTVTTGEPYKFYRVLGAGFQGVARSAVVNGTNEAVGLSVRCIKD